MNRRLAISILCIAALSTLASAIPNQITYQGTLKDHGVPVTTPPGKPKSMTFQLTDQGGANPYSKAITNAVTVTNGLFSTQLSFELLGAYTWDSITPYLKVSIDDVALNPTEPVTATAYANVAINVVNGAITTSKLANGAVTVDKLDPSLQNAVAPTGTVVAFAGPNPPAGWLLCDGKAYSRSQFPALFAAIGNGQFWGAGDGANTFNVPDLRGRTPIGAGLGPGLSMRTLGDHDIGEESHKLKISEMPKHDHGVNDLGHTHTGLWAQDHGLTPGNTYAISGIRSIDSIGAAPGYLTQASIPVANTGISILQNGGDIAHNVMQPSVVINFIIKI